MNEMQEHVLSLASEHGITVEWYSGGGRAFPKQRLVKIRPVKGPSTYFTALHELGHIVGEGRSARKLEREANAWAWALRNATRKPTPGVRKNIARCLNSYLAAGRRSWGLRQNMIEPEPGHVFWRLADPKRRLP